MLDPTGQPPPLPKFFVLNGWALGLLGFWAVVTALAVWISVMSALPFWSTIPFSLLPLIALVPSCFFFGKDISTFATVAKQYLVGAIPVFFGALLLFNILSFFLAVLLTAMAPRTPDAGDEGSLAPALFLMLISIPLPESIMMWFAIMRSKLVTDHNKVFVLSALCIAVGYSTSGAMLDVLHDAVDESTSRPVLWTSIVFWTMKYIALDMPLQMVTCYAVGLLLAEAHEAQRAVNHTQGILLGWGLRASYYAVDLGWESGLWAWWVFLILALVELGCLLLWIWRKEQQMPPSYRSPHDPFHYNAQVELTECSPSTAPVVGIPQLGIPLHICEPSAPMQSPHQQQCCQPA